MDPGDGGKRLHLVFLGCGAVVEAHSRTLLRMDAPVRRFYASRSPEKAAQLERRYHGAGSYGDYEAALADGRIDAAFVATPPSSHLELTLRALRSGKDVIVEKPAFLRAADFDQVEAVQTETGRRVLVAENYCYKPLAGCLRSIVASGEIGDVRFVHVNALKKQERSGWRNDPGEAGGGALFEGGIHWIDLMANLGPKVRASRGFRSGDPRGLERSMVVVLDYEGGGVGTLFHSWEIGSPLRGLRLSRIYGTAGSRGMFRDFLTALATGKEARMTLARARQDLELVESAYANGREAS
jgi:UDP-N-acetylglucosamine 3-dehydrogenase